MTYSRKTEIIQRVCDAKLKEIRLELDGFLVHDLGLVPHLNKVIILLQLFISLFYLSI